MRGKVEVRSPLPSLVTITDEPVSAINRLAPVMPTSAARNFSRSSARASATRYSARSSLRSRGRRSCLRRNSSSIVSLVRWMTGAMIWLGRSPLSWTIYSPRSVSTTAILASLRCSLRPISSLTIDLPLVTSLAPACSQSLSTMARASAASRRVMHLAATLRHLALIGLEIEIEMRQRVVLDGAGFLAQRVEFGQLRLRRLALKR